MKAICLFVDWELPTGNSPGGSEKYFFSTRLTASKSIAKIRGFPLREIPRSDSLAGYFVGGVECLIFDNLVVNLSIHLSCSLLETVNCHDRCRLLTIAAFDKAQAVIG